MKQLWVTALAYVMADFRRIVTAARKRQPTLTHDAKTTTVRSFEMEIAAAQRYFASRDFRILCDMAGVGYSPERALAWIQDTDRLPWSR